MGRPQRVVESVAKASRRPSGHSQKSRNSERLDARLTPKQKKLLTEAAELNGQSLTQFVVFSAVRRARRLLREEDMVRLTDQDREALINALLSPPEPSQALKDAWRGWQGYEAAKT